MKSHASNMVDLSGKKRAVYRVRARLIVSVILLLVVVAVVVILLVSCYGK
jgi:uncharacterized Tic20 family protein